MTAAQTNRAGLSAAGPAPDFDPLDTDAITARLSAFLRDKLGVPVRIGHLQRFTVGFSWVTLGFRAEWTAGGVETAEDLILRIGPPTGIMAPYRASPEFLTLQTLADSAVPVPGARWYSDDSDVFGAPFYICEKMPGTAPVPWTSDGGPAFDEAARETLGAQFIGALAALHNYPWQDSPAATAIPGCSDPARVVTDRIDDWVGRMRQWSVRRYPMLDWATLWFRANAPRTSRVTLTHGDYRIGNFLVENGRITAILDWELVMLADPMEDLGWVCMQAWRGRSPYMCHLLTREELCARYEALTGEPVDDRALRYWEAFGAYKLVILHLAAAHCYEARGFNDLRMAGMGAQVPRVLLQMEAAIERAS